MKRVLALMLIFSITAGSVLGLTGCEDKQLKIMTKGEWAQKLAEELQMDSCEVTEPVYADVNKDNTYYNAVQNCAAWDIFDKTENFEPDSEATVDFAIASAVRAIGEDKIAKSSYNRTLQTENDKIDFFNSVSDMDYISGGALYSEWGEQILEDMDTILSSLELKQHQDIGLTDKCVEISDKDVSFSMNGTDGVLQSDTLSLKEGMVLVINPSELYPEGKAAKVTSIKGKKFTYTEPSCEEVLDHLEMSGTYQPEVIGVIPMGDDVKVEKVNGKEAVSQRCSPSSAYAGNLMYVPKAKAEKLKTEVTRDDIEFSIFNKEGKKGSASGSASAKIGIRNIKATADISMKGLSVKKAYAAVDSTLAADLNLKGSYKPETKQLGKVMLNIYGAVTLELQLNLIVGASGELSINWSLPTTVGVDYEKGKGARYIKNTSGSNLSAEANAEAYIKPGLKGVFKVLSFSIASCGLYSGVQVKLNAKGETKKAYYCIDLKAYVPLECFAGGEGKDTLLGQLGIQKSWTIWDEKSSKIKKEWHIENGKRVDKCTHPEDATAPPVKQEEYKKIKLPELKLPDFKGFDSSYFSITSPYFVLKENTSDKLAIKVPAGYKRTDIVFHSDNEDVVTVTNGGVVTAKDGGAAQIKVATKDGKYCQYIVVSVLRDYSVEFTPLSADLEEDNVKGSVINLAA